MTPAKRFLFLQGVCSPFFRHLALSLRSAGHRAKKINFTAGDSLYWRIGESTAYRGSMEALPDFYTEYYQKHDISDIILFGDCRPVHQPAIACAKQLGIKTHVFEEGYFRPNWITLERDGVNGNSTLPRDPAWYREMAKTVPHVDNGTPVASPFWKRASYDVGYNFWAGLNPILHPGVRSHVPYSPAAEYLSYLRRGIRIKYYEKQSKLIESRLLEEAVRHPFFLLPLQLATDAQIVHHSPFKDMAEAMRYTLESFSRQAPSHSRLAVKIHPLDPGFINYRKLLAEWSSELDIVGRTFFLESGNLPALLTHTAGVVTVNSTVGSSALIHSRPTIALGKALYSLEGLTFQEGLDGFWMSGERPDNQLFHNFRNVVISQTQENGGFYSRMSINKTISNCITKLIN